MVDSPFTFPKYLSREHLCYIRKAIYTHTHTHMKNIYICSCIHTYRFVKPNFFIYLYLHFVHVFMGAFSCYIGKKMYMHSVNRRGKVWYWL